MEGDKNPAIVKAHRGALLLGYH